MNVFTFSSIVVFSIFLSGCATYPDEKLIGEFAEATEKSSSIVGNVYSVHLVINKDNKRESDAKEYVAGTSFCINNTSRTGIDVPITNTKSSSVGAQSTVSISDNLKDIIDTYRDKLTACIPAEAVKKDTWGTRVQAVQAIHKYAVALRKYADPKETEKIESTIVQLNAAIVGLATAAGAPGAKVLTPVGNALGSLAGFVTAQGRAVKIRNAMQIAHPYLEVVAGYLKEDTKILLIATERARLAYERNAADLLVIVREDDKVSRSELYEFYIAANAKVRKTNDSVAALNAYTRLIDGMVKAHKSLSENQQNSADIGDFLKNTDLFENLFKLIKT